MWLTSNFACLLDKIPQKECYFKNKHGQDHRICSNTIKGKILFQKQTSLMTNQKSFPKNQSASEGSQSILLTPLATPVRPPVSFKKKKKRKQRLTSHSQSPNITQGLISSLLLLPVGHKQTLVYHIQATAFRAPRVHRNILKGPRVQLPLIVKQEGN